MNPAFEEELRKALDDVWDNRANLNHGTISILKRFSKFQSWKQK